MKVLSSAMFCGACGLFDGGDSIFFVIVKLSSFFSFSQDLNVKVAKIYMQDYFFLKKSSFEI